MVAHKNLRIVCAIVVAIVLGWFTAYAAQNKMQAGILVLLIGAVINAIVVTVISDRLPILIGIVPVIVCTVCSLFFAFGHYAKYEGMSFSQWWDKYSSISAFTNLLMIQLLPAAIASGITHAVKPKGDTQ